MAEQRKRLKFRPDKSDVFLWMGVLAISGGAGMIFIPAGFIILGIFLIIVAIAEIKPSKGG